MIVWGVDREQLELAAENVGVKIVNFRPQGKGWGFRLGLTDVPAMAGEPLGYTNGRRYQRVSVRRQVEPVGGFDRSDLFGLRRYRYRPRINAVCWHGHRDFMRDVYRRVPTAKIKTHLITYTGKTNFEHSHEQTARHNVGSAIEPMRADHACECSTLSGLERLLYQSGRLSYAPF